MAFPRIKKKTIFVFLSEPCINYVKPGKLLDVSRIWFPSHFNDIEWYQKLHYVR